MRMAAAAALAAAVSGSAGATGSLTGLWGAPGANLTLDPEGGRLQQDCAQGSFGPVQLDGKGRFQAAGRFEAYVPGPQRAEEDGSGTAAHFEGAMDGDTLVLTVRPGQGAPQTLRLTKDRQVKLIRCY